MSAKVEIRYLDGEYVSVEVDETSWNVIDNYLVVGNNLLLRHDAVASIKFLDESLFAGEEPVEGNDYPEETQLDRLERLIKELVEKSKPITITPNYPPNTIKPNAPWTVTNNSTGVEATLQEGEKVQPVTTHYTVTADGRVIDDMELINEINREAEAESAPTPASTNYYVTVHTDPGLDEQELSKQVGRRLEELAEPLDTSKPVPGVDDCDCAKDASATCASHPFGYYL